MKCNLNKGNKYIASSLARRSAFFYLKKPRYMPQLSVGNKFQYQSNSGCLLYQAKRGEKNANKAASVDTNTDLEARTHKENNCQ